VQYGIGVVSTSLAGGLARAGLYKATFLRDG
jgi:hypothetical protein